MYVKLAFRNAKRSAGDYLLYITTLIILSALMMFSNILAEASGQNGLQAGAVPALIVMVTAALLYYINGYMLNRRAKEFAAYMLLGMKKGRIAFVFFGESLMLGVLGLAAGIVLGVLIFIPVFSALRLWFTIEGNMLEAYALGALYTTGYFIVIQAVSLLGCIRKIKTLQIKGLMTQSRTNQTLKSKPRPMLWTVVFLFCVVAVTALPVLITGTNDMLRLAAVNVIIFPLILSVWTFYKAAFHWLAWLRVNKKSVLYTGNRLYFTARLLSKVTSNIMLNTVLSVYLLFSAMTFSVGFIIPNISGDLFDRDMAVWMSFAEICMCLVFIAMYFTILSVRQVVEAKESRRAFQIMSYLGRNARQRKAIIRREIIFKYTFPAVMCVLIMSLCVGPVNGFLNATLPADNLLPLSAGIFSGCFLFMYLGYSFVAYRMSVRHICC